MARASPASVFGVVISQVLMNGVVDRSKPGEMNMHTQAVHSQDEGLGQSTPCGFSHIAIPSRDLVQSKRFFVEVLGDSLASDGPAAPVQFGDFGIVLGL